MLTYANDNDNTRRIKRDVTAFLCGIGDESVVMDLAVIMCCMTSSDMQFIGSQITVGVDALDVVNEFGFLGSAITTKNYVILVIKYRITLADRCYHELSR